MLLPIISRQSLRTAARFKRMSSVILGDDAAFEKIAAAPGKKIYYFTASWCPPCKAIAPVFEKLSKDNTDIKFVKIDVDSLPTTAQTFSIRSVPTFVFMSGTKPLSQVKTIYYDEHFPNLFDPQPPPLPSIPPKNCLPNEVLWCS